MLIRKHLRQWNKKRFGNISQLVKVAAKNLLASELLCDQQRDHVSKFNKQEVTTTHAHKLACECEFWRQKSMVKWIKYGDANIVFFHATIKKEGVLISLPSQRR